MSYIYMSCKFLVFKQKFYKFYSQRIAQEHFISILEGRKGDSIFSSLRHHKVFSFIRFIKHHLVLIIYSKITIYVDCKA